MKSKGRILFEIFITFLKIGAFTFGGGYAMIAVFQHETVERKKWITDDDILEIVAIAESTPGPIAINAATFIGYRVGGFAGAFFGTLGVVLPSFIIIFAISFVLRQFQELQAVRYAFFGIRAGVLALLVKALWTMYKKAPHHIVSYIIMAAAFAVSAFTDIHALYIIAGCAVTGLVYSIIAERRAKNGVS
ncbi:MAG: chromate transporter [Lachnospiraceae bacterium]|nr:chromate transporter [Lachnospiraceae bacterium]